MKNVVRRLASRIYWTARKTVNTIRYLCTDKNNRIVINAWVNLYGAEPAHRNLGDELNFYLVRELTGKHVFNYANLLPLDLVNYSCIGSILEWLPNPNKIVWGTGAMYGNQKLCCKPLKVCAVRGPLTRQYLLGQGIECPEVYGDPALLLPLIYRPAKVKKYKVGIIPHICDFDDPLVQVLSQQMRNTEITVIRMGGYADWHDVIDEIEHPLCFKADLVDEVVLILWLYKMVFQQFCRAHDGLQWCFEFMGDIGREFTPCLLCLIFLCDVIGDDISTGQYTIRSDGMAGKLQAPATDGTCCFS